MSKTIQMTKKWDSQNIFVISENDCTIARSRIKNWIPRNISSKFVEPSLIGNLVKYEYSNFI